MSPNNDVKDQKCLKLMIRWNRSKYWIILDLEDHKYTLFLKYPTSRSAILKNNRHFESTSKFWEGPLLKQFLLTHRVFVPKETFCSINPV